MTASKEKTIVLVVDDAPDNLDIMGFILRAQYKVKSALNGHRALQIAHKKPQPGIILLDVMMPDMDGYEVCRQLKADPATSHIPIIFVTAKNDTEDEQRGLDCGAADYITKPIQPVIVLARVKTQIELCRALQSLQDKNEELNEAAQLRDDIDRILMHDLKSPLNLIINNPEILLDESIGLSEEDRTLIAQIKQSGYNMLEMINRSLDMVKMEQQQYVLRPVAVDLGKVIKGVLFEQDKLFKIKKLCFKFSVKRRLLDAGERYYLAGEQLLCYSLFSNLLKNAVEASAEGQPITLNIEDDQTHAIITIHNSGIVPEDIRAHFFDKYRTAGKRGGTGLGTYSAKLLTSVQLGEIRFETDKNQGTDLIVTLPIVLDGQKLNP